MRQIRPPRGCGFRAHKNIGVAIDANIENNTNNYTTSAKINEDGIQFTEVEIETDK